MIKFHLISGIIILPITIFNFLSMKNKDVLPEFYWVNLVIGIVYLKNLILALFSLKHHTGAGAFVSLLSLSLDAAVLAVIILGFQNSFSSLLWLGILCLAAVALDAISCIRTIKKSLKKN